VAEDGRPDSRPLRAGDVARIAEAFELPRNEVLADAALVSAWLTSEHALLSRLGDRHDWDNSMAPYYVGWLRGGGNPAG
jgi:hypothetical protein